MNELISTLDATCVAFVKISFGVVMLALAKLIRKRADRQPPVKPKVFQNYPTTVTTATAATSTPVDLKVVAVPPEMPPQKEETSEAPIQCGNCNNLIKTQPVGAVSEKNQVLKEYVCEHCGMRVRVPAG